MGSSRTNALERSAGDLGGNYRTNFAAIFTVTNTVGTTTNYFDLGAATNCPTRYHRVRLVPEGGFRLLVISGVRTVTRWLCVAYFFFALIFAHRAF